MQTNTAFINAWRYGGDVLDVFGDFPTLTDLVARRCLQPAVGRSARPVDPKAIKEGLNKRQTEENVILNLAFSHPDLLTGVNPATGKPQLYGSVGSILTVRLSATPRRHPEPLDRPTFPVPSSLPGNEQPTA